MKPRLPAIAFGQRLLAAQGVPDDIARDVAEHLVESDRVGYTSHGLSILPNYRRVLAEGFVKADGRAKLLNDRGAMLAFDGDNGFGQHVGKAVMQQAIERARQYGQCIVTLRRTHHLGRMGYYGEMAAEAGLILLAFTNVVNRPPTVAPYGGAQACLTTNPCASPVRCRAAARPSWSTWPPARSRSTRRACWRPGASRPPTAR